MPEASCVLQELARKMAEDASLRAIWVDAQRRKVSFALQPGFRSDDCEESLREIVARHSPESLPGRGGEALAAVCTGCEQGDGHPLPMGIRMLAMPGAGVLLEKQSCPTATRMWRWSQFNWVQLRPRSLDLHGSLAQLAGWKKDLAMALACGLLALAGFLIERMAPPEVQAVALGLYVAAYLIGGWHMVQEVVELLVKRTLDVHFLMLAVAVGAAVIGHWWEGAVLLFLFSLSGALEHMALARTEREIKSLFREAPKQATIRTATGEQTIAVDDLVENMELLVRPGEQFSADATVIEGESEADEATLTGESIPVPKRPGDPVLSGTLNSWGSLVCRVDRPPSDSALAKIIRLIREAQESKAPSQRLTDRFGTGYTYAILLACFAMFLIWWLVMGVTPFVDSEGSRSAFYRAMTLLVVASPCALVLSIPSAILAGIAAGARRGILFRGGIAIENLAVINRVAFDKTGTITTGDLEVQAIESYPPGREDDVLAVAVALEHHAAHPIARAIRAHGIAKGIKRATVGEFRSTSGMGIAGSVQLADGEVAGRIGRRSWFSGHDWVSEAPDPGLGFSEAVVEAGDLRGRILLSDRIRPASGPLLADLKRMGLALTMLTGDRAESANRVATAIGLTEADYRAGLSPEAKVEAIQSWRSAGERVAMIGDWVNDAPSLAASDVAVGMGLRGSDAVLEQSDVVLMKDRLENFSTAYLLSRKARAIIYQNLAISLGVIILMVLAALGSMVPLTAGVIAHEGSTVIVVLNSLRLLLGRRKTAGDAT